MKTRQRVLGLIATGFIFATAILAYFINMLVGVEVLTSIYSSATILTGIILCAVFDGRLVKDKELRKILTYFFVLFIPFPNMMHTLAMGNRDISMASLILMLFVAVGLKECFEKDEAKSALNG